MKDCSCGSASKGEEYTTSLAIGEELADGMVAADTTVTDVDRKPTSWAIACAKRSSYWCKQQSIVGGII